MTYSVCISGEDRERERSLTSQCTPCSLLSSSRITSPLLVPASRRVKVTLSLLLTNSSQQLNNIVFDQLFIVAIIFT